VLDADTRRNQADSNYQQALAELTQDYVALQKSLGLGWAEPAG
jgi:multidrug efflux system outer membrane protein